MADHILYSFRRCPYAIRARMALCYAQIRCELRELQLRDKPLDMLSHSPKGTVPVLITSDQQVIDESLDVMLWAIKQHDPEQWMIAPAQALALIKQHDNEFKPLLDCYKYADRYPDKTPEQHRESTLPFIHALEDRLSHNTYLLSSRISLADVALFPFIRQYAFVDKDWFDQLPFKQLQLWLDTFLASELFQNCMNKYQLFNEGHRYWFPGDLDQSQISL